MSELTFQDIQDKAIRFRDERDWEQFHNPKDLVISMNLEAAELLECFQWSGSDLNREEKLAEITEELADVMTYCLYIAHSYDIDLLQAVSDKIDKNATKYPVEKSKGTSKKYTEL